MDASHMRMVGRAGDAPAPEDRDCSIERAFRVVGTRSAMLLMREAHFGTTRFDDFVARIGITEAVAAARLKELVAAGLLTRRPYREPGRRTRAEYVLTPCGADLLPVLLGLLRWGDRHGEPTGTAPLALRHAGCGEPVSVQVRCAAGHEVPLPDIEAHRL